MIKIWICILSIILGIIIVVNIVFAVCIYNKNSYEQKIGIEAQKYIGETMYLLCTIDSIKHDNIKKQYTILMHPEFDDTIRIVVIKKDKNGDFSCDYKDPIDIEISNNKSILDSFIQQNINENGVIKGIYIVTNNNLLQKSRGYGEIYEPINPQDNYKSISVDFAYQGKSNVDVANDILKLIKCMKEEKIYPDYLQIYFNEKNIVFTYDEICNIQNVDNVINLL